MDYQWYTSFTSVFTAASLQIPWYAILGNHDYGGEPEAQVDYYKQHMDNRWTMPSHLFSSIHTASGEVYLLPNETSPRPAIEKPLLEVVYIDSLVMVPQEYDTTRPGGKHEVSPERAERYLAAVEGMLAASTAAWLVVAGHFPVYSVADHGDTPYLVERLAPLLRKYGVAAYFNGHDHVLQHIERDGVSYFTSGHGTHSDNFPLGSYNARLGTPSSPPEGYRYSVNGPGFAAAQVTTRAMSVQFIDRQGKVLYTTALTPSRQRSGSASGAASAAPQIMAAYREATQRQPPVAVLAAAAAGVALLAVVVLVRYVSSARKLVNQVLPQSLQVRLSAHKQSDPHLDAMERGVAAAPVSAQSTHINVFMVAVGVLGCGLLWLAYRLLPR